MPPQPAAALGVRAGALEVRLARDEEDGHHSREPDTQRQRRNGEHGSSTAGPVSQAPRERRHKADRER